MKWTKDEIKISIDFYNNGLTYGEIANKLNRTFRSVEIKMNKLGFKNKNKYYEKCICKNCDTTFDSLKSDKRIFCSIKCSCEYNNLKKKKHQDKKCLNCNNVINNNDFCNISCKNEYYKKQNYYKIENNIYVDVRWVKKYLVEKYGEKCMNCGWDKIHPITNNVPIQLNHIDGNSENNNLNNVELLCPNCHSLTPNFGSLNKGNGRQKRRKKRNENKNYDNKYYLIKPNNKKYYCKECNKELSEKTKTGMCSICYNKSVTNTHKPNYEQLCIDINELGYCGTGRKYNVSDNTIRNWKKGYEK